MVKTLLVGSVTLLVCCVPADAANSQTASCQIAADRFAALSSDFTDRSPFALLTNTRGSGFTADPRTVRLDRGTPDLIAWAAAQTPPVELPDELRRDHAALPHSWLEQLPGVAFYAINSVGGTAQCYVSTYFEVDGEGKARIAAAPAGIPKDSCMVTRSFGTIDRQPVIFEEHYTFGPAMSSRLIIANWNSDRSWAPCQLTLAYEPVFLDRTLNTWDGSCIGPDCDRLRSAAYRIVAAVQSDPQAARRTLLAELSESQQLAYEKAEATAYAQTPGVTTGRATDPGQITKEFPFRMPYAEGDRLYIAHVGHFTIGWRYFADWSVTFQEIQPDGLIDSGSFAIGMWKGRVTGTSIEPL